MFYGVSRGQQTTPHKKKRAHRLGASQVDNLWATIAVLLLLSALPAVVSVRDAWPTTDRAPPLILRRKKKKMK